MSISAPRTLFANRFEVEGPAGSGGMGNVFRARDLHAGGPVAIKVLRAEDASELHVERFGREARLLAALHHPGIVGYVSHGVSADGRPYLAMEWLDGEDLRQRLRRQPLGFAETVTLLRQVTIALAFAHDQGVIHRDLKPSNIFLRGGDVARATILDFGIARRTDQSQMTRTGLLVGTPEYMAPEQARGDEVVGAGADVFSLGCVIYECLTGRLPFSADHIAAVLAKILFDDPPRLRASRGDIPPALEDLVTRMLAKDPADRAANAGVLLRHLEALAGIDGAIAEIDQGPRTVRAGIEGKEQRLLSVLVATAPTSTADGATLDPHDPVLQAFDVEDLREALGRYGARVEWLADGSLVATLGHGHVEAMEQAARAVQCAIVIRERWPAATVALATGRGILRSRLPVGEALDRAGEILHARLAEGRGSSSDRIVLDEATAGLLGSRAERRADGLFFTLRGEGCDASRPLLGQPTPCLGRESEIGALEAMLGACVDESTAQAALVTAPSGYGKSRIRHELLRRLPRRGDDVLVMVGGCEPLSAGTPYGPLGQAIRRLVGAGDDEPAEVRRDKLIRRVAARLPAGKAQEVAEFLGELCGIHFPAEDRVKLRAARKDPRVMSDQIMQALLAFLRAECADRPVLLVLEDLQWGDAVTVKVLDAALRALTDAPLMILALGRPEVLELFPNLWKGRVQVISLRPLGRRAGERLARQLLGDRAGAETITRIVERAAGNALWLEELIRAAADGDGDETPPTIMAMLQARIGQLDPDARRVLRAASVFGEAAWEGGIAALLGEDPALGVAPHLETLHKREILVEHPESRFAGERELRFCHTLMREAAYSLLTEEDRALGHRLAGAFLERMGERDPVVLGEHARRGGEGPRAVAHYILAAEHALDGNDIAAAIRHARRGLECAPGDADLGILRSLQATASFWGGDLRVARDAGMEALARIPRGSERWLKTILTMWLTTTYLGEPALFESLRDQFRAVDPLPGAIGAYVEATSFLITMSSLVGQSEEARYFLERLDAASAPAMATDAGVRGWVRYAHGVYRHWIENDLHRKAELARETIDCADLIGDRRMRCMALVSLGMAEAGLGAYEDGARTLRDALDLVHQLSGENYLLGSVTSYLAFALTDQRDPARFDEAIDLSLVCLDAVAPTAAAAGVSHVALARVHAARGDLARAEDHARRALRTLRVEPAVCPVAFAALVRVLLLRDEVAEAAEIVREGLAMLDAVGTCSTEVDLLFCAADVCDRAGDRGAAREYLREARTRLRRSAAKIPDAAARVRFLTQVPLHAEVLARARVWLDPAAN